MAGIDIKVGEFGTTRVFSLSMTEAQAGSLCDDADMQSQLLGAAPQNPQGIEVFPLSDLGEMGLAGFLRDGVDAHPDDIDRDRIKLAALDGWVLLVHSSAYASAGARLSPDPALTLIGTYAQTPTKKATDLLQAEAAAPYTGVTPPNGPPEVTRSRSRMGWIIVVLAVFALPFLIWAFA